MSETRPPTDGEGAPTEMVPATPATAPGPASADMVQLVTRIDRAVKQRRDVDTQLMNYWLYLLLVSWVTLGIYGVILFFKRIGRVDGFTGRKRAYYDALVEWTRRYAQQQGKEDDVHHELSDLHEEIGAAYGGDLRPVRAGMSFLLSVVTLGIYGFYVLYRMNAYWWAA